MFARKPLHIISTSFLEGTEVLVRFSDGTAAVYEAEELEKLRPTRKRTLRSWADVTPIDRGTTIGVMPEAATVIDECAKGA